MTERTVSAIVLAAGQGTRMRSSRPKPLHRLCGRPMLSYVLDSLGDLRVDRAVVVVGHGAERVRHTVTESFPVRLPLEFVVQGVQRGTGDAVMVGLTAFDSADLDDDDADVVVLPGDTPLLRADTINGLVAAHREAGAAATLLTARLADPSGYGRIVRAPDGRVVSVVEDRDASPEQLAIAEVNTSIYCFRRSLLGPALRRVGSRNAQGEYYLTDVVAVLREAGYLVTAVETGDTDEIQGVNDRIQLARAEAELRSRVNELWLRRGVTMLDPSSTYVDTAVVLAPDVTLFPNTLLQGTTTVAEGAEIGPDTRLVDCTVGERAIVERTTGHQAEIGAESRIGPFVALEPGARVKPGLRVGPHTVVTPDA
jgi:bifunctional UDP-N-acetylglucosamine pyrophosphorylase / glucosamine-1-phosphate N-acetyltransferase